MTATTSADVWTIARDIVQEASGVAIEKITPQARLVDDLEIDSLSMVEIGILTKDRTGVLLPDDGNGDPVTVQDLVDLIAAGAASPVA